MLSEDERRTLENWVKRRSTAQGLALRARIVLACAEGGSNLAVAARLRVNRTTVAQWRARFLQNGWTGCPTSRARACRARSPTPRSRRWWCGPWKRSPRARTHWSKRELARQAGISPTSVHRIWRAFGLQPWRTRDFKISPDPLLIDKIRDVVGLYLAPPANAVVFSVDEKPQIQALERTAPVLPMMPGVPERRSFDYVRHGTIDLFAALNIATGKVIGKLSAQHRAVDFRDFLDQIDRQADPGLAVHVICDNLSAHKAPAVHRWLLAHPRVHAALHPDLLLLDQPGRAVVRRTAAPLPRPRRVLLTRRAHHRAGGLDQDLERHRPALQVDQDRRPDHRPHLPLLLTHLRTGSLGHGVQRVGVLEDRVVSITEVSLR